MRIASVSKAYSGAVALALVSRGQLALDDTIGRRLPGLPRAWAAVTLRQLLNHTSGLPDYSGDREFRARVAAAPRTPLPPRRLLQFGFDKDLEFTPGSRYEYSNSDNIAVGLMAAAAPRARTSARCGASCSSRSGSRGRASRSALAYGRPTYTAPSGLWPRRPPALVRASRRPPSSTASCAPTPADGSSGAERRRNSCVSSAAAPSRRSGYSAGPRDLPLPHAVRNRVRVHGQHPRLHAVRRGQSRRATLDDGVVNERYIPAVLPKLRAAEELAVCAALNRA